MRRVVNEDPHVRCLWRLVERVLAFCLDWPGGGDGETGLHERRKQGLPSLLLLVGEHDGENAVVAQDAATLLERVAHISAALGIEPPLRLPGDRVCVGSVHPLCALAAVSIAFAVDITPLGCRVD